MHEKEFRFIEAALWKQRVTIRRTPRGHLVFRKNGKTIGFLLKDDDINALDALMWRFKRRGLIEWPPP